MQNPNGNDMCRTEEQMIQRFPQSHTLAFREQALKRAEMVCKIISTIYLGL